MPHDPLQTVLRLRQQAVDDATRGMAASLTAAGAAADAARAAERIIAQEADLASDPDGDDSLVEAFAAWLPSARQHAAQARALHERQEAEAARCRASLTVCRGALETIEALIARRGSDAAVAFARRAQQALDEAARQDADGPC